MGAAGLAHGAWCWAGSGHSHGRALGTHRRPKRGAAAAGLELFSCSSWGAVFRSVWRWGLGPPAPKVPGRHEVIKAVPQAKLLRQQLGRDNALRPELIFEAF